MLSVQIQFLNILAAHVQYIFELILYTLNNTHLTSHLSKKPQLT